MKTEQIPTDMKILIFFVGAGLVAFIVWTLLSDKRSSEWGFRDLLKNPAMEPDWEADRETLERKLAEAQSWTESGLRHAVRHYVFEVPTQRDGWDEYKLLGELGDRVHPLLLEMLWDTSLHQKLVKVTGKDLVEEAPINRICDLLETRPPEECIPALAPFATNTSNYVRNDVLCRIAATGSEQSLPFVQTAFSDEDEYIRSYTIIGLKEALAAERLTPATAAKVFELSAALYAKGDADDRDVAELLVALHPAKAAAYLCSPSLFKPGFRLLHTGLRALRIHGLKPDRNQLLALLHSLETEELSYPNDYALGEVLRLIGLFADPSDASIMDRYLSSANAQVSEGAADGLLALHGEEKFRERLFSRIESNGLASLTTPQLHCHALFMYDAEVNNGGHSQYFFNTSGMHWQEALAGLEAIGARERHALLAEALSQFGKEFPAIDRTQRKNQLAKIIRRNEDAFDEIDERYFASKERLEVLTAKYVIPPFLSP